MSQQSSVSESLAKELSLLRDEVGQLQNKVTQQEAKILKAHEMIEQLLLLKSDNQESHDDKRSSKEGGKGKEVRLSSVQIQYRTCYDLFRAYKDIGQHHLKSGMFWVDLDGPSQGEPAIYVYCNMTDDTVHIIINLKN